MDLLEKRNHCVDGLMVRTLVGCPPQPLTQDPQGRPACFLAPFWRGRGDRLTGYGKERYLYGEIFGRGGKALCELDRLFS